MKTIIALLAITFLTVTGADAQSIKYKELQKAYISDAGEMMSTYELSGDEIEIIKEKAKSVNGDADYIISRATESGWPSPLNDFSYRIDHPAEIKALNVRLLADLGDLYIVVVPAKENKRGAFKIKEDIYIVFTKKGIRLG
jgi:hypothetical protein